MNPESLLIVAVICLSVLPLLMAFARSTGDHGQLIRFSCVLFWLGFPIAIVVTAVRHPEGMVQPVEVVNRPVESTENGYLGSKTCQSCHPHEHATWHASYHRTMTQLPTPESVIGDFDQQAVQFGDDHYRLATFAEQYWVEMKTKNSETDDLLPGAEVRPIVLTTGSHHMQAYWFPLVDDARVLAMFPLMYLADEQRWVPRYAAFLHSANEADIELGRWNETCIQCHSTYGRMGLDRADSDANWYDPRKIDTRVGEFGIACEACHGPGEQHVRSNSDPTRRYRMHLSDAADETIVNPAKLSHRRSAQACGQCHSVMSFKTHEAWFQWAGNGHAYRPGDELADSTQCFIVHCGLNPTTDPMQRVLDDDPHLLDYSFWSDGMVRVSGREYNGLIETPCFQRGEMSCITCHRMHQDKADARDVKTWANDQLELGMEGNLACVQCHTKFSQPRQLEEHTHHMASSSGSNCYNCHMSYTTYGLLKAMRSHQIDSPNVATTLETGRPNACNQCHLDQTLQWTSDHLANWYAADQPELSDDERTIAASVLWLLRGDAGQRALMAWSYGWEEAREASGQSWMAPYLAQLLDDPYAAVRCIAHRSLRRLPSFADFSYDYVGTAEHRADALANTLTQWRQRSAQVERPLVLLDNAGNLRQDEFDRLLGERDDSPITLNE